MPELPYSIQRSIRSYKAIETDGLTLYPVLVKEYNEFLTARPALEVLHQSLPVRYLREPLLAALYEMDYDAAFNGGTLTGLFSRTLLAIALSLRLGEGESIDKRLRRFQVVTERAMPSKLTRLLFMGDNGAEGEMTPATYQKIRPIIAAQNGVRLESERADPELVQAEKDLSEMNSIALKGSVDDVITAVAALSGQDEADIEEWPILKLTNRQQSYQRLLDYVICGIGQMSGTTWKGGNPHPSPFFDRADEGGFGAHMALGDFAGGAGERAVRNAGQQVS